MQALPQSNAHGSLVFRDLCILSRTKERFGAPGLATCNSPEEVSGAKVSEVPRTFLNGPDLQTQKRR